MYEVGNFFVYFYYLVIEKNFIVFKIGDILVFNRSGGFIEIVVVVDIISDIGFLEI